MTLPIVIPSPPSAGASPASDDSLTQPRTPVSPTQQSSSLPSNNASNNNSGTGSANAGANAANKRKPSRRANTAERRATHNAVERQRRETLNGRFLDLAALLPNLSQIRRPSKSSIVNSSIAHIHASRRHRLLASRELRLLKLESDALRRELNEWRDRAGIPRVEEPVRGEGFGMVLSGELEMMPIVGGIAEGDEDEYGYGEEGGADDEMYAAQTVQAQAQVQTQDVAMAPLAINTNVHPAHHPGMMQRPGSHHGLPPQAAPVRSMPHPANVQERMERLERLERLDRLERMERMERLASSGDRTMIASPTAMTFDAPAVPGMYEPQIPSLASMNTMGGHGAMGMGMNMYGMQQMQNAYPQGYEDAASKFAHHPDQAYLASLGRRRSGSVASNGNVSVGSNMNGSPVAMGLDARMARGRSGSMSGSSSGSASPPQTSYGNTEPEWGMGHNMGMGMQHGQQGMMVGGGMGGMGSGNVAFAMMM